ncbi:MAG: ABC transporter ATP-binding protein [Clostridiales Family XIII bacterium]|jgi:NitT/TauT family transport system ATP-binding protein|nr:ABC transporter ATP-binding protein [Clostridiales Family XIII bacterium]
MKPEDRIEISIEELSLSYNVRKSKREGGNSTFLALQDINLQVREGEFLSLVGPSGCGKSTLLYVLAGLNKKTSGCVRVCGEEINGPSLHTGIIMQAYALFPWRTIQKNVEFGLEIKRTPKAERAKIAAGLIELVGLSDFAGSYPYELSGGMKQRIAIARALAYDPDVLLMDEPFAAVDEQTKNLLHEELLRIWGKTNKTIIFVTHSIEEAIFLSDRVAVMTPNPGTIKAVIDIDIDRPRAGEVKSSQEFSKYRSRIWQLLQNSAEMTDDVKTETVRHMLETRPQEAII